MRDVEPLTPMDTIDQAAEWRRLQELYREKSDDELEAIAPQAYELTDVALDVLQREIASRGLKIEVCNTPPPPPEPATGDNPEAEEVRPDDYELVAAYRVWDRGEAEKIKKIYEEAGVACYLGPKLVENVADYKGSYERGVEFKVRALDEQRAMAAIRWAFRDEPDPPPGEQRDSDYRCPKCKSDEIVFENLEKETPDQPDYLSKFHWHCDACGHEWEDDGVEG